MFIVAALIVGCVEVAPFDALKEGPPDLTYDVDGDGIIDPMEEALGSDPLNPYSWPGDGVWPDFSSDAVDSEVYAYGETFPDFTGTDQYDQGVHLQQFWGELVLLNLCGMWCGPCWDTAAEATALWEPYRDEGFVIIDILQGHTGSPASLEELEEWVSYSQLTFPTLSVPEEHEVYQGLYSAEIFVGYVPQIVLLDREHRIVGDWIGAGNEELIAEAVEALLDAETAAEEE